MGIIKWIIGTPQTVDKVIKNFPFLQRLKIKKVFKKCVKNMNARTERYKRDNPPVCNSNLERVLYNIFDALSNEDLEICKRLIEQEQGWRRSI